MGGRCFSSLRRETAVRGGLEEEREIENSLERDVWDVSWTVVEMTNGHRCFGSTATPNIGQRSFGSRVGEEATGRHIRAEDADISIQ
jgi:hypothetical protein